MSGYSLTPSMSRPTTITDERILEAARKSFIQRGFEAPSAEIAQRAGVSEGTIFKRFPTKEALFYAALGLPEDPAWVSEWPSLVGIGDPRSNLTSIARDLLVLLAEIVPRYMALQARGMSRDLRSVDARERPLMRYRRELARYLEAEMERGRLQQHDAKICAEMLMGAAFVSTLQAVALGVTPGEDEADLYARRLVDTIWAGLNPAKGE